MICGSSTVENLIPGSPQAIASAMDCVGSGVAPAQHVEQAWHAMQIPSWRGSGGDAWQAFTPTEAQHMSAAPGAFRRVAAALLRYEAAFQSARAEAQAAIDDARAAERATADAQASHQAAIRRAAEGPADSPARHVDPFVDPGAMPLSAAEARYQAAKARLQTVGDEVAAEIRAAASTASGVSPSLTSGDGSVVPVIGLPPPSIPEPKRDRMDFLGEVLTGMGEGLFDSAMGAWKLLPFHFMIDQANGGPGWGDAYDGHWKQLGEGYAHIRLNPIDAVAQFGAGMIALDMWETNPPRALGHAIYNLAGLAGLGRAVCGKFGRGDAGIPSSQDSQSSPLAATPPSRPPVVPDTWQVRRANDGKGWDWRESDSNAFRTKEPDERYPNGNVRFYNEHNQSLTQDGRPGSQDETHFPIREDGTYDVPKGWRQ